MTRENNRADFPGLADIVDQVRAVFPDAKLLHGEEGGREIGKRPDGWWIDIDTPANARAHQAAADARGNGKGWGR